MALKLPKEPSTKEARDWLTKHREPGAVYFNRNGGVIAQQWFLPLPQFRSLLRFAR